MFLRYSGMLCCVQLPSLKCGLGQGQLTVWSGSLRRADLGCSDSLNCHSDRSCFSCVLFGLSSITDKGASQSTNLYFESQLLEVA